MKLAPLAALLLPALLVVGCGGSESDSPSGGEPSGESETASLSGPGEQQGARAPELDPDVNTAANFNLGWRDLIDAQKEWEGMASAPEVQSGEAGLDWVRETGQKLVRVRTAFKELRSEADGLDLPSTFTTKGEFSRPTVNEYLSAYDDYLVIQEAAQAEFEVCMEQGKVLLQCSLEATAVLGDSDLASIMERLKRATMAMYGEANQPSS